MAKYTQRDQWLRVSAPSWSADAFLLREFRGREALSELFSFQLDLLAPLPASVPFEEVLGQPIAVEMLQPGSPSRWFHGLVSRLLQGKQDDDFRYYQAEMVPRVWLLRQQTRSRVFQQKTVPDILKIVLADFDFSLKLYGEFPLHDYCVQYRESDWDFAARLMEEEGIHFYFRHTSERHELVITDASARNPELAGFGTVLFDEVSGGRREEPRITSWEKEQTLCVGKMTLRDHSFELPRQSLEAVQFVGETVAAGATLHRLRGKVNEQLEVYDFPGAYAHRFDGVDRGGGDRSSLLSGVFQDSQRTARLRIEAEAARSLVIHGRGGVAEFAPGFKFHLTRHFDGDGEYLLTSVEHTARVGPYRSGGGADEYKNLFTCIPAALPFRPERKTARPIVHGTQTARVVGPPGEEIFTDKYGRVKVQFHWDRESSSGIESSCWLRVVQPWAGNRWGAFFWPRVGHEVVVGFEHGDPDCPIILGSVYNAENMPPFSLPDGRSACGLKSCTVGGDPTANFNCVVFYDQPGDEHLQLHSETYECLTSETTKFSRTPGPHIEVSGSLPRVGSGTGGGFLEFPEIIEFAGGKKLFEAPVVGPILEWAATLPGRETFTWGSQTTAVMAGDQNTHIIGGVGLKLVYDIENFLLGPLIEHIPFIPAILLGTGGDVSLAAGPRSSLTYGPGGLKVDRGFETETVKSEKFWTDFSAKGIVVKVLVLAIGAATGMRDYIVGALGTPKAKEAHEEDWKKWVSLLGSGVISRLVALLQAFEGLVAKTQKAEEKAKEAAKQAQFAALSTTVTDHARDAETRIAATRRDAEQATAAVAQLLTGVRREGAGWTQVTEGDYLVSARDVTIRSANCPSDPLAGIPIPGPSSIALTAEGGGALSTAAPNGSINLSATALVTASCGEVAIEVSKSNPAQGKIKIDNGLAGSITIGQGPALDPVRPQIVLASVPPSIKLSNGIASIELTATGITLKVGAPPAGSEIALTATGIKLTSGLFKIDLDGAAGITLSDEPGTNKLNLTPAQVTIDGLNITQNAAITMLVKAVQATQQASAMASTTSGLGQVQ